MADIDYFSPRFLTGVTFDYSSFIAAHGRQPKGYGCWLFEFGHNQFVFFTGTLTECIKKAVAVAKDQGVNRMVVAS